MRRGATYSARLKVPVDLVSVVGRTEYVRALGTKNREDAKRLVAPVVEGWRKEFDELRSRKVFNQAEHSNAPRLHYDVTLAGLNQRRREMPTQEEIEVERVEVWSAIDAGEIKSDDFIGMINKFANLELLISARTHDARLRKARFASLLADLKIGDFKQVTPNVSQFLKENRLLLDRSRPDYRGLCEAMLRAELEALKRSLEQDQGDFSGMPSDPVIVRLPSHDQIVDAAPCEAVMEVFEQYAAENPKGVKPDTLSQARRDIGLFVQVVGQAYSVSSICKKDVRTWKKLLQSYPVKAAEAKIFEGMSIQQVVIHNESVGKPSISTATINRHLANLSAFCAWLHSEGYLQENPVVGMSLQKVSHAKTLVFQPDELRKLFSSPLFTGCEKDSSLAPISRPGNILIRDHRFWVPLIMLYSAARPAEVGQLELADVRQQDGHWIMEVTDEGDGDKSVKTKGSRRIVPLHKQLIELGLLEYRQAASDNGLTRLFPNAIRNSRGQMLADFSRFFAHYLTKLCLKDGRGLSLYSFRHGATDAFRRAGYLDHEFQFLIGHGVKTVTSGYGMMSHGTVERRAKIINDIEYEGLDLTLLKKR
jgi:integrase